MTEGNPESIRYSKRSDDLFKWIHKNEVMNLSVVIKYSIVDSIINAFSWPLQPFNPKRRASTIIESFWFNKAHLMLLIF